MRLTWTVKKSRCSEARGRDIVGRRLCVGLCSRWNDREAKMSHVF